MSCDYCWPGNCCGGPNCLDDGRIGRGNKLLKVQKAARDADPRPSEVIVREMRDEWERK